MKEKFQLADRINAEKRLKFGHKALLNQAISLQLGNQKFYATDKWLAEQWGESIQVIKKTIRELKQKGLIYCELIRRKHIEGDKSWYNKRYITVDFQILEAFLGGADTAVTKLEMKERILTDEDAVSIFEIEDSSFGGNYTTKDNEYYCELYGNKTAGETQETDVAATPSPSALDFDEFRIIALLSKHGDHLSKITSKFPDFIECLEKNKLSIEQIEGLEQFHKAMLSDEKLRNEYRSIT